MERWTGHYQDRAPLKRNHRHRDGSSEYHPLSVMEKLDIPPSAEELRKTIDTLTCGKAPGNDGIPSEVIKVAKASSLPSHLHQLQLIQCLDEGMVHQDMRDSNIITLYKNKGGRSNCNSYRGISLVSIVGKTFARVALNRLQSPAERVYTEAQCGFRAGRSTIDTTFSPRQLK